MKKRIELLSILYSLLIDELIDIKDGMVLSHKYDNLESGENDKQFRKPDLKAKQNADWLIKRIIFLESSPEVSAIDAMKIRKSVIKINPHTVRSDGNEKRLSGVVNDPAADFIDRIHKMQKDPGEWYGMLSLN